MLLPTCWCAEMTDDIKPVAWLHDGFISTNKERVEHDEMRNRQCGFKAKPLHALYLGEDLDRLRVENERLRALLRAKGFDDILAVIERYDPDTVVETRRELGVLKGDEK